MNIPLSVIQQQSVRDRGVKESVWVAKDIFLAPAEEDNDARHFISSAITTLGRGNEVFKFPETSNVAVEWVGNHTSGNNSTVVTTEIAEKDKFVNLMKDIKTQTTILYVFGGGYL